MSSDRLKHHRLAIRRRTLLVLIVTVAAAGAGWLLLRPSQRPQKLLEQALIAGRRDNVAAANLLRQAIRLSGGHYPDAEIALCLALADENDWEAAASQFAVLDTQSCRADLLLRFGNAALDAGRNSAGLEALEAVRRRGLRDSVPALERLVKTYQDWGQTEELIIAAREWTRLEPNQPRPWIWLIQTLKGEQRRDAECLKAIRDALVQDLPEDARRELQHRLVEQLIVCGEAAEARPVLSQLLQTEGETFRLRLFQVDLYRLEGEPGQALELLEQVFPLARDRAIACLNRGVILLDLRRYAEAAGDLRRTVAAYPANSSAHFKLSEAYRGLGMHELARRHWEIADGLNARQSEIARLLQQVRREFADSTIPRRLATLYRELGEDDSARLWEERATRLAAPAANPSTSAATASEKPLSVAP